MNFYDNYISLCNKEGKSPSAVAVEIGLTKPTVHRWKNGSTPTDATIRRVAEYFGVSTDYLLGNENKKITPDEPELTEGEREWVELFRQLSDDQRQMIRGMMRGIVNEINNER